MTVTDQASFPGTLATVNSVLEFHDEADVLVVTDRGSPPLPAQVTCLQASERVRVIVPGGLDEPQRRLDAGQLRAIACRDAAADYDVLVSIDAGCVLCSDVRDVIDRCRSGGGFVAGGLDSGGQAARHAESSLAEESASDPHGVNPALFFYAVTPRTRDALARWADHALEAPRRLAGASAGDGNGGAALTELLGDLWHAGDLETLDDRLWAQHATFWESIVDFRDGRFVNVCAADQPQRAFHCDGCAKFWLPGHRERVIEINALQTYPYVWFLAMLWFGRCGDWSVDPHLYLPEPSRHLFADLVHFLPQIEQVLPRARYRWNAVSDVMIDRALSGIPRAMTLGASMSDVIALVALHPRIRRYVEVGSYEGGSILTLGLRFLNRDIDFYAVESFMGSLDGTMDGCRLPSRGKFLEHLAALPRAAGEAGSRRLRPCGGAVRRGEPRLRVHRRLSRHPGGHPRHRRVDAEAGSPGHPRRRRLRLRLGVRRGQRAVLARERREVRSHLVGADRVKEHVRDGTADVVHSSLPFAISPARSAGRS